MPEEYHIDELTRLRLPWQLFGFLAVFVAVGIMRFGVTYDVDYRWGKVLAVEQMVGKDIYARIALVEVEGESRRMFTSDRYLQMAPNQPVCVAKRTRLSRRFTRYTVELPVYCRTKSKFQTPAQGLWGG